MFSKIPKGIVLVFTKIRVRKILKKKEAERRKRLSVRMCRERESGRGKGIT
jgi:hypothetical protein